MSSILDLLEIPPSPESVDYVANKSQFHLHSLLTEQRHARTWDLSFALGADTEAGLRAILAVDDDLSRRVEELADDPAVLERLAAAVAVAVESGRRVYVYGCGATGRLAKQMESTFWRPFWLGLPEHDAWPLLEPHLPTGIADALIGEMTGADRALVSSLEGFEDLPLVGELQLQDHGIARGDVVICVTEGGETSSVIGTVLAALSQYDAGDPAARDQAMANLYFVYNNPDEVLAPFDRSRRILEEPLINKINLATGPQAIAGSTRMQATTIETFVVGTVLEEAIYRLLHPHLSTDLLAAIGFDGDPGVVGRLRDFSRVRAAVDAAVPDLVPLTEREMATYKSGGFSTYLARRAMVTVFTDCTERSPTFRLFPLDVVDAEERRCWVQVWTDGDDAPSAWRNFLGRRFRGLDPQFYGGPLRKVEDAYLRRAALASLAQAGNDQELRYDFSFSTANVERRGPRSGDLGVLVLVDGERDELSVDGAGSCRFADLFRTAGATLAVVRAGAEAGARVDSALTVDLSLGADGDPLQVRRQVAVKILLNAHSTAVMARLGRVIGNTMTNVSPSNLKLIGRATFLIQSHVNDVLKQPRWSAEHGAHEPIGFADANAVLFDAIEWVRERGVGQTAEVALCIVRILESLVRGSAVGWEAVHEIVDGEGLAAFLQRLNPALDPAARDG